MSNVEYCAFEARCGACPVEGLAPRTRKVMPGIIASAMNGIEGADLNDVAKSWLQSIEPPKNAPNNPFVVSEMANAAAKIAAGNCTQYSVE